MKTKQLVGLAPLLLGVLACSGDVGSPMTSDPGAASTSPGATGPGVVGPVATVPGATTPIAGPSGTVAPVTPVEDLAVPDDPLADTVESAPVLEIILDGQPLYARIVRLTHDQWENSARYLLQIDETGQRQNLADDVTAVYEFSNHEELLFMNANLYRDYQMAAEELAAAIGANDAAISAVYPGQDAQGFIETVGRRAFRRPLTGDEVQALQALYDEGAALTENGNTPHARGAAMVLQSLLQSPHFLYRTEFSDPGSRLTGYEIAAKLSLLLRGVTPDDNLLDRAANGEFDNDAGVRALAEEMIDEPAAREVMRRFHGELFKMHRYESIVKIDVPDYDEATNYELQEAAYMFFDRIFSQSLGVRDIFLSTVGYVGPLMAQYYGVQAPASGMQEMDLGPDRPGFFTHLPFLILNSQNLVPDPIHRGVTLNIDMMCTTIPLPPPGSNIEIPPGEAGWSNRERISAASGPGSCGASCHAPYINPLGFAFENFDGLGRIRVEDNGNLVNTMSRYPFAEGNQVFSGAAELMQIMSEAGQVHDCYAKHLANFALQREMTTGDQAMIDAVAAESRGGASLKEMILALVSQPAFTTRATGGAL